MVVENPAGFTQTREFGVVSPRKPTGAQTKPRIGRIIGQNPDPLKRLSSRSVPSFLAIYGPLGAPSPRLDKWGFKNARGRGGGQALSIGGICREFRIPGETDIPLYRQLGPSGEEIATSAIRHHVATFGAMGDVAETTFGQRKQPRGPGAEVHWPRISLN